MPAIEVKRKKNAAKAKPKKTPRAHKPADMTLEEWQIALRRQFGVEQNFKMENLGPEPIFSEFRITNPQTKGVYRVAVRGERPGDNYCSCPDYAVNTLGTCKHIEFALSKLRRRKGGAAALRREHRPPFSEVYLRYGARREAIFNPAADCPDSLRRLADEFFEGDGALKRDAFGRFDEFLKKAARDLDGRHELRCYEDTLAFIAQVRDDERRRARIDEALPKGVESPAFRKLLKVDLYPYQRLGALFAARAGRCLIADDMGLGKTVQAIGAAEILAKVEGIERALIVCPTSLKHQWSAEIARFSGRSAIVVEGPIHARAAAYAADSFFKIVNYDVVHRDREAIARWAPNLIVLDEAQRIKNWKTRAAQSVKRLPSEFAVVMTGTPLENRLEELHSIVEFVDRHRLGPLFRFLAEHQHVDEAGKVVGYRELGRIAETLGPILLRRTKNEVLRELPERLEKTFFVPMTPQQMDHHEENREIVARIVAKWRRCRFLSDADQRRLMIALQNMRMACNSTYLLDHQSDHGVKADELAARLEEIFERSEDKVVIFSQWLRTHELLERRFDKRRWPRVLFHGGVPGPQRGGLVHRFREDPDCRLFLSTDAGGVGLNLQCASVVVNVDQPWNPAIVEQRIGRVHRLGQRRPVSVINYVAQGTIEHGMLSLIKFKRSLFAGVLDGGESEVFLGGTRLNRFMESVETATGSVPPAMPASEPEAVERREASGGDGAVREIGAGGESPTSAREAAWSELAVAGMAFVEKLGRALSTSESGAGAAASLLERDERTGRAYLKIPAPEPEVLLKFAEMLGRLAGSRAEE